MPARYLSDTKLARLSRPGEIADEDTVSYFTLSADDLAWLAGFNREENRLGVAVQLAGCPGWVGSPTISPTARWLPDPVRLALVRQLRQGTLRAANIRLVNAHHVHPLAALWVSGSLSSSDGTAVPAARPQPHRPGAAALFPRRGDHHLHPRLRPALNVRHQSHPDHLARSRRGARRDLRQRPAAPGRVDEVRAHHREPADRQAAPQQPAEQPRQGAARVWPAVRMIYLGRYVADEYCAGESGVRSTRARACGAPDPGSARPHQLLRHLLVRRRRRTAPPRTPPTARHWLTDKITKTPRFARLLSRPC